MEWWWHYALEIYALSGLVLIVVTIPWILMAKKESTSVVAWCLLVFFLPVFGTFFWIIFGYQSVRPLERKRRHRRRFLSDPSSTHPEALVGTGASVGPAWEGMARLAQEFGATPVTAGNQVTFYHEGLHAFDAMFEAIRSARHHVHIETFILQPDDLGHRMLELLVHKAKEKVEVRVLYDAMGSFRLRRRVLLALLAAGGRISPFLPLNPFRKRIQVNLRDHRKIMVVDGRVAFTGGLNIGDEYLGKVKRFGFWRDTHLRLEGPAVTGLQRVFAESWDFAAKEKLSDPVYFPRLPANGPYPVQVIHSGPDQANNSIREIYFAAILRARKRLWIASPYFVPDAGLRDALCLSANLGVDVRFLGQYHPDKWIPFYASRYYWADILEAGAWVYQYTKGMLHSKVILVDDDWATVGTANLDNRSLHLNFEVNCLFYAPAVVAELEAAFRRDLRDSIRLDSSVYADRSVAGRLVENACRLMSPVL